MRGMSISVLMQPGRRESQGPTHVRHRHERDRVVQIRRADGLGDHGHRPFRHRLRDDAIEGGVGGIERTGELRRVQGVRHPGALQLGVQVADLARERDGVRHDRVRD